MPAAYTTEFDPLMFEVVSLMAEHESLEHIVLHMSCLSCSLPSSFSVIVSLDCSLVLFLSIIN